MLHNQSLSFFLICPNAQLRAQFQKILETLDTACNVYLYDPQTEDERNYDWLLNIAKMVDYTILNLDDMPTIEKNLAGYLISLPNTFYLTNDQVTPYNMLNVNQIYNLDWLAEKLKEE